MKPKRILIVAMCNSMHTQRWARMVARHDTSLLLFPVYTQELDPSAQVVRLSDVSRDLPPGLWTVDLRDVAQRGDALRNLVHGYKPWKHSFLRDTTLSFPNRLQACIERFQPHVLHSMEIQLAGYLCLETARRMGSQFPPWILSNWGSDLDLFRKVPDHQARLSRVCSRIDYYLAECARDRHVARSFGYRGPDLPIIPASGGSNVSDLATLSELPPSQRRTITVKGYHGWSGRALLALSALALARDHLVGFQINVPLAPVPVQKWIAELRTRCGVDICAVPYETDHRDALRRLARSRVLMGVGISDGISTSLLEAMAVGTFPIQSATACASEWIECGRSGFVVPAEDTRAIADALIAALEDDRLVDQAAQRNREVVSARWSAEVNGEIVWTLYNEAIAASRFH